VTVRTPSRRRAKATAELDRAIGESEARAIVIWRGERVPLSGVPERIARISGRDARERLYGAYVEALEAVNPLHERRLAAWMEAGDPVAAAARTGLDPAAFAAGLERLALHTETPYYAALRRYIALIGIEHGDASEADLWYVLRGSTWAHWFGAREVARALAATGRSTDDTSEFDGWRAAEARLTGTPEAADPAVAAAIGHAWSTLVGSPEWLEEELRVDPQGTAQFVDFAAFVRLWRIRRLTALLTYELRLYGTDDPGLQRAYYAGIVGHLTGVAIAEAGYLVNVSHPFASAAELQSTLLGDMLTDALEHRAGARWWRDPGSKKLIGRVSSASSVADAVAELGYDALDWRPVLRQIRTRLIGEMSGYGGPNITTRAGTRKV
jgi:hypothetical protein